MIEEITPEIARQWLRGDQPLNVDPAIVRAYLEKCEELDSENAMWSGLADETRRLFHHNLELMKENARLQDITEEQHRVLGLVSQAFYLMGLPDEEYLVGRVKEALSLTATEKETKE